MNTFRIVALCFGLALASPVSAETPAPPKADAPKSDASKPDAVKPEAVKSDAAKSDPSKADAPKTDAAKPGTTTTKMPMSETDKRAKAVDCSKQADAKKLHGEARKKFRSDCKRDM